VVVRGEVYENPRAKDMVRKARWFDPLYAARGKENRDKAIALYEEAIGLQPGASINAALADRIAELYAFYECRERGIRPDWGKAASWWERCIELTDPRQRMWAEAHMGLGGSLLLSGHPEQAVAAYRAILDVNVEELECPRWQRAAGKQLENGTPADPSRMARSREAVRRIKRKAVGKIYYVLIRVDGAAAVSTMLEIAKQHDGTPVGADAKQLAEKALADGRVSLYRYRELEDALAEKLLARAEASSSRASSAEAAAAQKPPASGSQRWDGARQDPGQAATQPPSDGHTGPSLARVIGLIAAGAAILIGAAFLIRRAIIARRVP
jgi:tetratricopeptide (TPR) repeat protein